MPILNFLPPRLNMNALLALYNRTYTNAPGASAAETHVDPREVGYCYLDMVKVRDRARVSAALGPLARRSAVEDLLLDQPDVADGEAFFRVTISRPQGFKSGHYVVHVERVHQSESAMRWQEVLAAAPFGAIFGAKPEEELPVRPQASVVPNPLIRRFFLKSFAITFGANARHNHVRASTLSSVEAFTKFFPIATAVSMTAHFHPTAEASRALVSLGACWSKDAHANLPAAQQEANFQLRTVGPPGTGGMVQTFTLDCPFDGLNVNQMKPEPRLGAFPLLYLNWTTAQLGADSLEIDDVLFQLWIEIVVDASPTQSIL